MKSLHGIADLFSSFETLNSLWLISLLKDEHESTVSFLGEQIFCHLDKIIDPPPTTEVDSA